MINDHAYWNGKFEDENDTLRRSAQTRFFAQMAIESLPQWCVESIRDCCATICDMGCGGGEGAQLLKETFGTCDVFGVDISEVSIQKAAQKTEAVHYKCGDIKTFEEHYDVIFSSNVLEHFYQATAVFDHLLQHADQYLILLVPFREYYRIAEHAATFDFRFFPLRKGEYSLCYYKIIPMVSEQMQQHWIGEQALIIYKHDRVELPYGVTMENLYNGYMEERSAIISSFDQKLAVQTQEQEKMKEESEKRYLQQTQELAQALQDREQLQKEYDKALREQTQEQERLQKELAQALQEREHLQKDFDKALREQTQELEKEVQAHRDTKNALTVCSGQLGIKESCMQEVWYTIERTQNRRWYRLSLALSRFYNQYMHGNRAERRDFRRWVWSKLLKKDNGSKRLREFDPMENAKQALHQIRQPLSNIGTEAVQKTLRLETDRFGRQVFIFASVPMYDVGGGQRSAQMAKTFYQMGFQVHYIYGFDSSESERPQIHIPAATHVHIEQYSVQAMASILQKDAVLIFEIPYVKFEPYLDYARMVGAQTVYEHIDNWDTSLGCLFYDEQIFSRFLKKIDAVTVTAKMLGEKIEEVYSRDYLYLPNAVNSMLFEPSKTYEKPKDLVTGKKTLLYFGSLWGEWFDWDKIIYVAKNCDCEINLIGDYQPIADKVKSMPHNIHFLGLKKQIDLPSYLYYSDIALLPFKSCEIGKYVSPLKIFEYIAMNKPVLATPLDDIGGYPNVVASDEAEVWVECVNKPWSVSETSIFTARNNWHARCNCLLDYLKEIKEKKPTISVIVLNHNNMKVIFRCVSTLLEFNEKYHCEIIVVDNDSTDGSYEKLQEEYGEKIVLIKNEKNGCSSGRNIGARAASGELLFFLDSDQWVVSEGYMDTALDILRQRDSIGAVGWNAGWFNPGCYNGPIVDYLPNRGIENATELYRTDIAYLATSGFLMRKELFVKIDGFDEFYDPTCFEDTDISLKIRYAGYELAYCPYMAIMHLPHQTTQSGSKKHSQLMERNGTYFLDKWKKKDDRLLEYHL